MSKPTLKSQIADLTIELSNISKRIDEHKLDQLEKELKTSEVNIANHSTSIAALETQLTNLKTDLDKFKHNVRDDMDQLKRELISYVILSNASKTIDASSLTESAQHLSSGIIPASSFKSKRSES